MTRTRRLPARLATRLAPGLAALTTTALVATGAAVGTTAVTAAAAPGPSPAAASACTADTATVRVLTAQVPLGGTLRIAGEGWCHPDGGGSRIGVKLDEGGISRTDGTVHANRTIWAVVQADADGTFTTTITLPNGTTADSTPAFATGTHTLRLLSGSLLPGDTVRTVLSGSFEVVGDDASPAGPPSWPHATVTAGTATAWVERVLPAGDHGTIRLRGTGWTHPRGGASTVAVKLGASPDGAQHRRTGAGVVTHPSASGDQTVWALLAPGGGSHPNVREVATDGSFDVTLDLPTGLAPGDHLTATLLSGRFSTGDAQRTATTAPLQVGGVDWTAPDGPDGPDGGSDGGSDVTCVPTSATPTVRIDTPSVAFGGTLRISGAGWCNPAGGGSRIGVKIDEGAISRTDGTVHSNRSIWAVVQARHADGTFAADIVLPDGTAATSTPALTGGAHTLRLLTGSLAAGDTVRSVLSGAFSVGAYRPNGVPDPVDVRTLKAGAKRGMTATRQGRRLTVRVPRAAQGDWVFLSAYAADGSPRYPWSDRWFRAGARGTISVRVPAGAPTGTVRLVAQSGAMDRVGRVLGWTRTRLVAKASPTATTGTTTGTAGTTTGTTSAAAAPTTVTTAVAPTLLAPVPPTTAVPAVDLVPVAAPADTYVALGLLPRRRATADLAGTVLTVTLPQAEPGTVVTAHVYGVELVPAGQGTLDDGSRLQVDLGLLRPGSYRVAVTDAAGALLGWVDADVPASAAGTGDLEPEPEPTPARAGLVAATSDGPGDGLGFGAVDGGLLALGVVVLAGTGLAARRRTGVPA